MTDTLHEGKQHPLCGRACPFTGEWFPFTGALAGAWRRGYAQARAGEALACPYKKPSDHGGTWGYQLHRAWALGWSVGDADHRRAQGGDGA